MDLLIPYESSFEFLNNFMYALRTFIHQIVYKMGIIHGSKDFMDKIFTEKPKGTLYISLFP